MVYINEWLPNPVSRDSEGEWVELYNAGGAGVELSGWRLTTEAGKAYVIEGKLLEPGGYLILPRSETRLTLRNANGKLFLYDAKGTLVDAVEFFGTAKEGKSFARHEAAVLPALPTPGRENALAAVSQIFAPSHPLGVPLNAAEPGAGSVFFLIIGVGALFALGVLFAVKTNATLANIFFRRDKEIR
jgi:hypothetical protein